MHCQLVYNALKYYLSGHCARGWGFSSTASQPEGIK